MDRELNKQFKKLHKREDKILNKKENKFISKKISPIKDKIQEKIPDKLIGVLESAFLKGFQVVFEKGNPYIEKTYNKKNIQLEYDLNNYAIDKRIDKRNIKRIDKQANSSLFRNSSLSFIEGGVLGLLGVGLPDIPVFIAMIMKSIYEVALGYGYDYDSDEEKAYILLILSGSLSKGEEQKGYNEEIDRLGEQIDRKIKTEVNLKERMEQTSKVLSEAMLTTKFIQGFAIVGVIGSVANFNIINKIGEYASLKYKKRYLLAKS
ncbi:MAG: EcsC family protein, partial [Peptostreptococcales bacterium]